MRAAWTAIVLDGADGPAWLARTAARALVPRIERSARALAALANLNRTIHLPTYNALFFEASAARGGAP